MKQYPRVKGDLSNMKLVVNSKVIREDKPKMLPVNQIISLFFCNTLSTDGLKCRIHLTGGCRRVTLSATALCFHVSPVSAGEMGSAAVSVAPGHVMTPAPLHNFVCGYLHPYTCTLCSHIQISSTCRQ